MAEIGLAASIISVIQLAGQVAGLSWGYISGVKGASKNMRYLASELNSLGQVLSLVLDCAEANSEQPTTLELLSGKDGPLQKCTEELGKLRARLEPKSGLKSVISNLKWPLEGSETLQYTLRIERHKSLFNLALTADNNALSKAIHEGVENTLTAIREIEKSSRNSSAAIQGLRTEFTTRQQQEDAHLKDKRRNEAFQWLYPGDFNARHDEIKEKRQKNTGDWLPKRPEFEEWAEQRRSSRLLWGHGIPGAGKTFLSSIVVDHFRSQDLGEGFGIAHIYFNYTDQESHKPIQVLRSLVRQLATSIPQLPEKTDKLFNNWKKEGKGPTIEELYAALLEASKSFSRVFFIFDALDECDESQRVGLLPLFNRMGNDGIYVFLTSRPHPQDIQTTLSDANKIELSAQKEDIITYVREKIKSCPRAGSLFQKGEYNDKVILGLVECAKGMFLLVRLYTEYLCQKTTPREALRSLDSLKEGSTKGERVILDLAYKRAVESIRSQPQSSKDLAFRVLSWLAKAKRTLKTKELQTAVAVEPKRYELSELDLAAPETLVDVCASLVTIDGDTIRLAHYTVQEYLLAEGVLVTADFDTAMACTTYLSFCTLAQGACTSHEAMKDRLDSHPLLHYAAFHLNDHLKACNENLSTDMYLYFIQNRGNVTSWYQALTYLGSWWGPDLDGHLRKSSKLLLHIAAGFGHLTAVRLLLEGGAQVLAQDEDGDTALHDAAKGGNETVVGLLLDKGADIAVQNKDGSTALLYAAKGGHEATVGLLLDKGADIAAQNKYRYTALLYAAMGGHEAAVGLLLDKGADIAAQDKDGSTALLYAAVRGHEATVGLLLDKGADIAAQNMDGSTALLYAAVRGHEAMVGLLLDKGADIAAQNKDGSTALLCAAKGGHEATVGLLLDKGADIAAQNMDGYTALLYAAEGGHEATVGLLLDKGADIAAQDKDGYTALLYAAKGGYENVVRLLLDKGADCFALNNEGKTSLDIAFNKGYQHLVVLLEKGNNSMRQAEAIQSVIEADIHNNPQKQLEPSSVIEPDPSLAPITFTGQPPTVPEITQQYKRSELPSSGMDTKDYPGGRSRLWMGCTREIVARAILMGFLGLFVCFLYSYFLHGSVWF